MKAAQARAVYDRIGRAQDWQFYENRAVARLLTDFAPQTAHAVFEFGCGTARLAVRMLELLPPTASYLGVDVSPVMVAPRRYLPAATTCRYETLRMCRQMAGCTSSFLVWPE